MAAGDLGAGTVTFGAGAATATLTVATMDDDRKERRGTITATVGSGDGYVVHATRGSTDVLVVDNDWRLMITVPSLELTAEEGPATSSIYVDHYEAAYFSTFAYGRTRLGAQPIELNEGDVEFYSRLETATEADVSITNFGAPVSVIFLWRGYQQSGTGYQQQPDGTWLVRAIQSFAEAKHDYLVEGDETIIIHIEAKRDGIWLPQAEDGRHLRLVGTIKDTDTADWSLSLAPTEITEGRAATGGGDGFGEQRARAGSSGDAGTVGGGGGGDRLHDREQEPDVGAAAAFGGDRDREPLQRGGQQRQDGDRHRETRRRRGHRHADPHDQEQRHAAGSADGVERERGRGPPRSTWHGPLRWTRGACR